MKNQYKALLLSFALCTALLTGCGSQSPSTSSPSGVESEPPSSASSSAASQPSSSKPSASEESDSDAASHAASQSSSTSSSQDEAALSDNWVDFDIKLDGVLYKYPYVYQEFDDAGWILVDKTERGLDSGAKLLGARSLQNELYALEDNRFSCYLRCAFFNNTDEFAELVDCGIWSIIFSVSTDIPKDSKVASLELAKNIHIGSTEEEIVAAYGSFTKKEKPSNASEDFTDLIYEQKLDNGKKAVMKLRMHEGTLCGVEMSTYNN